MRKAANASTTILPCGNHAIRVSALRFSLKHVYYWSNLARIRQQEREEKLMTLSQENNALKNAVKRRNQDLDALKADYRRLKCYVRSLPPHLVPSWLITRASPPLDGACFSRNTWNTCNKRKKPVRSLNCTNIHHSVQTKFEHVQKSVKGDSFFWVAGHGAPIRA